MDGVGSNGEYGDSVTGLDALEVLVSGGELVAAARALEQLASARLTLAEEARFFALGQELERRLVQSLVPSRGVIPFRVAIARRVRSSASRFSASVGSASAPPP